MNESIHILARVQWTCIRHNRKAAVIVLVFSLGVLLSGLLEAVGALPDASIGSDPFMVRLALVDGTVIFLYVVLAVACIYERLWSAIAAAASGIMVLTSFRPRLVVPASTELRDLALVLWFAAVVVSLDFVRSAFKATPGRGSYWAGGSSGSGGDAQPECPACGSRLACSIVKLSSPFHCPACSAELSVRPSYRWSSALLGLIVAGGIAALLGPTGPSFAVACLAAWIPAAWAVAFIAKRLVPPQPVLRGAGSVGKPTRPSG